jgi:methionyl-tRNA synthetase
VCSRFLSLAGGKKGPNLMSHTYITTAIPYVNAAPHLGYALELLQADVLARHRRLRGGQARLLTGTDDNAAKNVNAARTAGIDVQTFVDAHAQRFADLARPLQVEVNDFLRTSTDPRHHHGVVRLWHECAQRDDFYQRTYQGLYCTGCEQFYTPDELDDGWCAEHQTRPDPVAETNWFFRLSRYQQQIIDIIESGKVRIEPAQRRNEVLSFLRAGLDDISVSRPANRAEGWGIPVPGDPSQVIYVWWEALANYVTALGYATGAVSYEHWWSGSDDRIHIIGKGIVRFHAIHWLAQLLSAGLPLPTLILVHDYITTEGKKLSKTNNSATALGPAELIATYGGDALRWWLLADVARIGDTDFTVTRLIERANTDLANGIGNLAQRVAGLNRRYRTTPLPAHTQAIQPTLPSAQTLPAKIDQALQMGDFRAATLALRTVVEQANQLIAARQPWQLAKQERHGDTQARTRLDQILAELNAICTVLTAELGPFLPEASHRLQRLIDTGESAVPPFARLTTPQQ